MIAFCSDAELVSMLNSRALGKVFFSALILVGVCNAEASERGESAIFWVAVDPSAGSRSAKNSEPLLPAAVSSVAATPSSDSGLIWEEVRPIRTSEPGDDARAPKLDSSVQVGSIVSRPESLKTTVPAASPSSGQASARVGYSSQIAQAPVSLFKEPSAPDNAKSPIVLAADDRKNLNSRAVAPSKGPASPMSVSALAYRKSQGVATGGAGSIPESEIKAMFLQVVEEAAARNPDVKKAMADKSATESDIEEVKGQRLPQIDLGGQSKALSLGSGSGSETKTQGISINAVTPIFDWGKISKTIESRTYLADAADSALIAQLETSAFDAASSLIELAKQRNIVELSQKYVDRMNELVTMLSGIVAVDTGRASELTQARARLLQAQASRSSAESKVRDAEISLRKMIGDRALPVMPNSTHWQLSVPDLDSLLSEVDNHPLVRQAQSQAKSAELQPEIVRASSLPQLNWVVGKSAGEDALGRQSAWETNISVSWAAFRGGSSRAAERAARERAEASREVTERQSLDLEYRIRASNQDALSMLQRADLYEGLSVESNKVRSAFYDQWYHLGRRTLLDVLISESDHYNNKVGEIENRFSGYAAIFREYASSGTLVRWLTSGK